MKTTSIVMTILAVGIFALTSCTKDSLDELTGSSSVTNSTTASTERHASGYKGTVYLMENATSGNNILIYNRNFAGMLSAAGSFPTGGTGTGAGLGSQNSLILDKDYLYACNAGSNDISILRSNGSGLVFVQKISSYGTRPISVTVHNDIVYVLNAGGSGNISGFKMGPNHQLSHIAGSDLPLSTSSANPAQIQFDHEGKQLVVTEKGTNNIFVYAVSPAGIPSGGVSHPSVGTTPFGFDFGKDNTLIVSDAFGGAVGASAATSYDLKNNGALNLVTGPVSTNQTAACWLVATKDGRFCYTTNAGSASVSGYKVANNGALTLLNPTGITGVTEGNPIDLGLSKNSDYLYVLNNQGHSISIFGVNNDGSLNSLGTVPGLVAGTIGIAAE
jgi:6-phosphogluconolactonase